MGGSNFIRYLQSHRTRGILPEGILRIWGNNFYITFAENRRCYTTQITDHQQSPEARQDVINF